MTTPREEISEDEERTLALGGARVSPVAGSRRRAVERALSSAATVGRRHALFLVLLAAGAALRAVAFFAYRPALIFYDSRSYLERAAELEPGQGRPTGYPTFLRLLPLEELGLAVVPFVQHLLGLLIAVLIYALLVRLGVRTWLAALATAPVLLDAYQLNIEQYVLSDTVFQLLVVAGCALLLWRRPLGTVSAAVAGLAFAGAALTRSVGLVVIVPVVLTMVFLRARPSRAVLLLASFALPLVAYAAWFHSFYGAYTLNGYTGQFLYARVAPFADCTKFSVPSREEVLCPDQPVGERPTEREFMWRRSVSPFYRLRLPREMWRDRPEWVARSQVAGDFARRVIVNQPFAYARTVGSDFVRGFAPTRTSRPGDAPVSNWQFQPTYPVFERKLSAAVGARADRELASFLRAYQRYAYAPGPLLGAGLLVGLLAALGLGRARHSGLRSAAFLFSSLGLVLSLAPAAALDFSWRYQLPQLVLLAPALALGLTALTARGETGRRPTGTSTGLGDSGAASAASRSEAERRVGHEVSPSIASSDASRRGH